MLSLINVYLFQAGNGILANAFLLIHIFTIHQVHRPRPIDIITCHLAFVHIVMLFTTLHILSEDMSKSLNFLNELKCKILIYMSRVTLNLSISTTCLLSIIQAITISPGSFCLLRFKHKLTNYFIVVFFCIWCLHLISNSNMIIYTVAHSNKISLLNISKYWSISSGSSIIMTLYLTLVLSQNVFFVEKRLLSNMYMVILCSHQWKSEYLRSMSISPRISPAKRATCTVLVLMSFFVIMYCVDSIILFLSSVLGTYEPIVLDIQKFVINIYATVSPLVLISSDKRIIGVLQNTVEMIIVLAS